MSSWLCFHIEFFGVKFLKFQFPPAGSFLLGDFLFQTYRQDIEARSLAEALTGNMYLASVGFICECG